MYALVNIFSNLNINKIFINRQTVFEVLAYNSNVIDRRYHGEVASLGLGDWLGIALH